MTTWDDLTAAALLGTARRRVDVAALPGALGSSAAQLAGADPAGVLLDAAALATPFRRAGARYSSPGRPVREPSGADVHAPVTRAAADRLAQLLAAKNTDLALEWLHAAAGSGRRVPARALPALLDAAARDRAVGAAVAAVLGTRGRWLAQFRPEWAHVLTTHSAAVASRDVNPNVWEVGDTAARRSLLADLHRSDPDAALQLVAGSWTTEAGEDREAFLDVLGAHLTTADETLLERALDDRRKGVRDRAARLLSHLPSSAFAARMTDRARSSVRLERKRLRSRLVVTPPSSCDPAMARDGVNSKASAGTGEQAWWLRQIVAATPLSVWAELTGDDPARVLALPVEGAWRALLLDGWRDAAVRQQNPTWAKALLGTKNGHPADVQLVQVLDVQDRAAAVASVLAGERGGQPAPGATTLLMACPAPWPSVLAGAVLAWMAAATGQTVTWPVRERLTLAGLRLPPDRAGDVLSMTEPLAENSPWRRVLNDVANTLTFRHQMLEELR